MAIFFNFAVANLQIMSFATKRLWNNLQRKPQCLTWLYFRNSRHFVNWIIVFIFTSQGGCLQRCKKTLDSFCCPRISTQWTVIVGDRSSLRLQLQICSPAEFPATERDLFTCLFVSKSSAQTNYTRKVGCKSRYNNCRTACANEEWNSGKVLSLLVALRTYLQHACQRYCS